MPTRDQVTTALRAGRSYDEVARSFGIPPGQAYLIATGLPADGSDALAPESLAGREGLLPGSSQHLANPQTEVATTSDLVRDWVRSRVAADEPLRAAEAARVVEPPPVAQPEATEDIVDLLGRDHGQVQYLEEQLKAIPGVTKGGTAAQQQRRASILDMMRLRLAAHETAEELHFWPAVREHVPGGGELADRATEQEQHGDELLKELEHVPPEDSRFDELVEELTSALSKHVAFEDYVFLKVKDAMTADQRAAVGRAFAGAKKSAPTRSHPRAPRGSKAAAALAAPLDRARDIAGGRPADLRGKSGAPDDD